MATKKRKEKENDNAGPGDGFKKRKGGDIAPIPTGKMEPPRKKRVVDKKLYNRGTKPETPEDTNLRNQINRPSNDLIKRQGHEIPIPVSDREIEQEALYVQKLKKKDDQEKRKAQERVAWELDVPDFEYDPQANIYEDMPNRSDWAIFGDYYTKTRKERGKGQLANSIELRFFDINAWKPDYTCIYIGRRGSGKTFKMSWDHYKIRKYVPRWICFTRTRVNKWWQRFIPDR
jgi:hypothetical protein